MTHAPPRLTFAVVPLVLALVVLIATYLPARRAVKEDATRKVDDLAETLGAGYDTEALQNASVSAERTAST